MVIAQTEHGIQPVREHTGILPNQDLKMTQDKPSLTMDPAPLANFTHRQRDILILLSNRDDKPIGEDITKELKNIGYDSVSNTSTSRALTGLLQAGLIKRTFTNARSHGHKITEKGLRLVRADAEWRVRQLES